VSKDVRILGGFSNPKWAREQKSLENSGLSYGTAVEEFEYEKNEAGTNVSKWNYSKTS